jgi:hypothetical protein
MARKKKRDRFALTPEEEKRAAMAFTPAAVHGTVVEAVGADKTIKVAKPDDASIVDLAQALNGWRWLIGAERHWIESRRLKERLAAVCREIEEIVPPLRAEVEQALKFTEGADSNTPLGVLDIAARPSFQAAFRDLDLLAAGRNAVVGNAILMHPETRMPPIDFWQAYAQPLAEKFARCVTRVGEDAAPPIETATYRFIVAVVPALTGEHVTFDQVRTHSQRERKVAWARRRR